MKNRIINKYFYPVIMALVIVAIMSLIFYFVPINNILKDTIAPFIAILSFIFSVKTNNEKVEEDTKESITEESIRLNRDILTKIIDLSYFDIYKCVTDTSVEYVKNIFAELDYSCVILTSLIDNYDNYYEIFEDICAPSIRKASSNIIVYLFSRNHKIDGPYTYEKHYDILFRIINKEVISEDDESKYKGKPYKPEYSYGHLGKIFGNELIRNAKIDDEDLSNCIYDKNKFKSFYDFTYANIVINNLNVLNKKISYFIETNQISSSLVEIDKYINELKESYKKISESNIQIDNYDFFNKLSNTYITNYNGKIEKIFYKKEYLPKGDKYKNINEGYEYLDKLINLYSKNYNSFIDIINETKSNVKKFTGLKNKYPSDPNYVNTYNLIESLSKDYFGGLF